MTWRDSSNEGIKEQSCFKLPQINKVLYVGLSNKAEEAGYLS